VLAAIVLGAALALALPAGAARLRRAEPALAADMETELAA